MRTGAFAALLALLCLISPIRIFTQTSNATLGGTVSDATGALIPGVSVTATNTATGIVTTVISNESGAYQFASLQTGTYKVTAELGGFQTAAYDNVTLGISQQVRLNFTLQIGSVAQAVEVTVAADTLIATSSSSVGSVLPENKIRELPLGGRSVMDLLVTTGGAGPTDGGTTGEDGYFAGGRLSAVNTTRDGFTVSDGRYNHGAFSQTYVGPDLVEEVRVITAPVDAEMGRGSGQVQMVTRSGTNQFKGSLFWANRNSALDASNWFNNFNRVPKDYDNRNQFGGRIGGPIIKNKTFFFVLIDEQRETFRQTFAGVVLTPLARQGIFRFFPGVDNQNATQNNPTVDRSGNPVRPPNATGDLQQFNVFSRPDGTPRDPNRPGFDPSGFIQNTLLARMPSANDYTVGDGLNTAGIRFTRRVSGLDFPDGQGYDTNRDQINWRIDHSFNAKNKLSINYTWERGKNNTVQSGIMNWPGGYNGLNEKWPMLYNGSLVSTLSSSVVNELRIGYKRGKQSSWAPWYVGRPVLGEGEPVEPGLTAYKLLPKYNGVPLQVVTSLFPDNFINWTAGDGNTRNSLSPLHSYADTLSWTKGTHAFKAGFELRFGESDAGNDSNFTPQATLGPGGVAVAGIDNIAVPGLSGPNQTLARNLLTDLSGSINRIAEAFDLRNPKDLVFRGYDQGIKLKIRDWKTTEYSWFFKDSWKARRDLTLNLGIHYEWFGVPYEGHGIAGAPAGGAAGLCGISCGSLTTVELVGRNSPNPQKQLWRDDGNNFAPSVGFSWALPWLGKDKTVVRGGYGWSYVGSALIGVNGNLNNIGGSIPGTMEGSTNTGIFFNPTNYLNLVNVTLPIAQQFPPLRPAPLDGQRSDVMQAAVTNRVSPYIQNFNFEVQREFPSNMTLDIAYVGTKGTHLWGAIPLNNDEIVKNGFLDAFNTTRAGGNAKLFDDMLKGLNLGSGVINGTTVTGSASLRTNTNTRVFIANGSAGQLADFVNRSTSITGAGGGFVRNSGLFPENFFVLNPQFNLVNEHSNPGSSTYHSLLITETKRLSGGLTNSFTYTFSRALGENDGDAAIDYRDPGNRKTTKALLGFDRTHAFTSNGTYELPFGPNKAFLGNAPGFLQRIAERWVLGGLFNWISGAPLNIVAPLGTINQVTAVTTPNLVGDFPKSLGSVTKTPTGVTYFAGLQQITDPSVANVTAANGLNGQFTNKAIADAQGHVLLVNPQPGQIGSLGLKWVKGPPITGLNLNLLKRVRITETKEFELRVDAVNVLNHPVFGNPNLNINSTGTGTVTGTAGTNFAFGRITSATGNRRFTLGARLNF